MINKVFFFTEPTIKDYRDMKLDDVLKEFLLFKGTQNGDNKSVKVKELISSALFVYGLKSNPTNKAAVTYYLEKEARQRLIIENDTIVVPSILWDECDKYNREHSNRKEETNE